MYQVMREWPKVSRRAADIEKLYGQSPLSLDLEYSVKTLKPTILGLSNTREPYVIVSVPWDEGKPYLVELIKRHPETRFIGHNVISADMMVLRDEGIEIPLEQWEDTILRHWLVGMHLSKSSNKSALEEDAGERRGRGFNNLGSMISLYTSLPTWKQCRGEACAPGTPCPEHDVFGYNGLDAFGAGIAHEPLRRAAILRDVEKLYPMHRKLAYVLAQMSKKGVYVDVPYVAQLRQEFERDKQELAEQLPFNARSDKQIKEFFAKRGVELENAQEATIREAVEEPPESADERTIELLDTLLEYKELGNGPDRWFAPLVWNEKNGDWDGFVDEQGYIHCHIAYFTSSARLMCSSPNLQNVAKRRKDRKTGESVGKKIRRAIIAPPGYRIVRGDYSNAENRNFLYLAGYDIPRGVDLHTWVKELAELTEDMEFCIKLGGAREAAKSLQHANSYLEGLQLLTRQQLAQPRVKKEIDVGARNVYRDWTFEGKTVTFTGVNLAKRAFGAATFENRRKALEISEKYFARFGNVRELHRKILRQVENEKIVRTPLGYALLSYGRAEDRCKTAAAVWGSQPIAHLSKLALIRAWDEYEKGRGQHPVLQIHDELMLYSREDIDPKQGCDWLREDMEVTPDEMPGFCCPADCSYGPNWRDQVKQPK